MNILWILDWKVNDTVIDKLGKYGAAPKKDLLELWKRIVFNMVFQEVRLRECHQRLIWNLWRYENMIKNTIHLPRYYLPCSETPYKYWVYRMVNLHYDRFTTPISDVLLSENGSRAMIKKYTQINICQVKKERWKWCITYTFTTGKEMQLS